METKKQELVIKITNRVIEVKLEDGTLICSLYRKQ